MGPVIFPAICRWTLFTHTRSFFFLFLYLFVQNGICACTSDAKALGWFSRNTSRFLWQKQKPEFRYGTSTKREISPLSPPPKKKTVSEWMRMRCKRGSVPWKPFHLTRNVSGISNQKFCLNRKGPRSWLDEKLTHLTLKKSKDFTCVKKGREINCINKMSLYPNPSALLDRERSSSFLRVTHGENLLCLKRKIRNCSRSSAKTLIWHSSPDWAG